MANGNSRTTTASKKSATGARRRPCDELPPSQRTGRAMLLELNLPQLQNLIRRDPASYRDEFLRQLRHFDSSLEILKLTPASPVKDFEELVVFLAHVAYCYPEEMVGFAPQLMDLIRNNFSTLHPDIRKAIVQSLMLLRSKNNACQITVLSLFFHLLRCRDKQLRTTLVHYITTDIRNSNQKCKNNKLNRTLQNHLFSIIADAAASSSSGASGGASGGDASDVAAKYCLDIAIVLYRKNVWNDNKTVNVIAEAMFSPHMKVLVAALKFFLAGDNDDPDAKNSDDNEEDDVPDLNKLQFRATFTKKSKGNKTKLDKAVKLVKRKENRDKKAESFNFSALHLINDPQGLAEKLFDRLVRKSATEGAGKTTREIKFDVRLMMMNLVSRIIGIHKLILLNVYPYFTRYLKPHQQDVTVILAVCAQAAHELVPPDAVEAVVRVIVNNFVTDAFAPEVIAAGLNAIREICARCPLAIEEELLSYACTFKNHRDKGVSMACRSLISLYRDLNPEMLPVRERGKSAAISVARGETARLQYGQENVKQGVDGAELLLLDDSDAAAENTDDKNADDDAAWAQVSGDEGADSDGWVQVSSDDEAAFAAKADLSDDGEELTAAEKAARRKEIRRERGTVRLGFKLHGMDVEARRLAEEQAKAGSQVEPLADKKVNCHDNEDDAVHCHDDKDDQVNSSDEDEQVEFSDDDEEEQSDSDDENEESADEHSAPVEDRGRQRPELTRFLTPADFAKLKQRKEDAEAQRLANGPRKDIKRRARSPSPTAGTNDNIVSKWAIEGPRKKRKQDRAERLATVMEGKKDRPKFGSRKGKERGSTTNKEKAKGKNFLMMVHKQGVTDKTKMSMRDKQIRQRKAIDKQKKLKH